MKKTILALALSCLLAVPAIHGEDTDLTANKDGFNPTAYAQLSIDYGSLQGDPYRWFELRAGFFFAERWRLGLGVVVPGMRKEIYFDGKDRNLEGSFRGVETGFKLLDRGKISCWLDGLVGEGEFAFSGTGKITSPCLFAEIRCMPRYALTRRFAIEAGAGYHGILNLGNGEPISNSDYAGPFASVAGAYAFGGRAK